jgi:hypothetical protein
MSTLLILFTLMIEAACFSETWVQFLQELHSVTSQKMALFTLHLLFRSAFMGFMLLLRWPSHVLAECHTAVSPKHPLPETGLQKMTLSKQTSVMISHC